MDFRKALLKEPAAPETESPGESDRSPEEQDLLERSTKKWKRGERSLECHRSSPMPAENAPIKEEVSDEEELDEANSDPDCPTIIVTKAEKVRLRRPWRRSLILRVLGRSVGYSYLHRRLTTFWKPEGNFELIALEQDYFIARFEFQADYDFARFGGPWMVLDHYLVVQEWIPNFDPTTNKTEKLLVWVRLPAIPVEYFEEDFLWKIGKKIGRPIKIDDTTSLVSKGKFARVCVEVDMTKPLLARFTLEGKAWPIEYEGIHLVCFKSGIYGHRQDQCGSPATPDPDAAMEQDGRADNTEPTHGGDFLDPLVKNKPTKSRLPAEKYGPWMLVTRKPRRPPRKPDTPTGQQILEKGDLFSRG
ncbi:uncharacterized protein LOC115999492 [Ipomoea triloba]|uniref:uncharacterized protein LOC115999492 n=1 Tax=Ipomoea triloba TaxID=35885 RepID=UPI00125D8721|nr:uncharacterized protein LOC115999492 [Ipomoea triloba]